jgi:hypothetical protein
MLEIQGNIFDFRKRDMIPSSSAGKEKPQPKLGIFIRLL